MSRMGTTAQSLSALLQRSTIDDHEEVIKACNVVLKKKKNDAEAQHVKVVALLKLDRFDDAIRVLEDGGDNLKKAAALEWSYALYKTGKLEEAASVAASSGVGRGAKHVEAQATYRAENFDRTRQIYESLLSDKATPAEEQIDLHINTKATNAQRHWAGQAHSAQAISIDDEDLYAFETTYNVACEHIAMGQLEQAQSLLKRAKELCETSEDLTEEDKAAELLPIAIQELYVTLKLGKMEEADVLSNEITIADIPDASTKLITQSNSLLTTHRISNPYLKHKVFNSTPRPSDSDRLFSYQRRALTGNSYVIDLLVNKYDGVSRATSKILSQETSTTVSPEVNMLSIFNVAAHTRGDEGQAVLKKVSNLLDKRPLDLGLALVMVQLHISNSNVHSAISVLEAFLKRLESSTSTSDQTIRFNPGLIGILISLHRIQGRKSHINAELARAARYWQQNPARPISLLRAAAISLFTSHDPSDLSTAGELFSDLHNLDGTDRIATAGFVASHAISSPSAVESMVNTLSPVQDLIADVDADALESGGIASTPAPAMTQGKKRGADDKQLTAANKRNKRVRKLRNKDTDTTQKPDPERWLPIRDRSSYRPKGRKGKQKAADRTQGGAVNEKSEETAASSSSVVQSKNNQGGGGGKKKKGKGKR